MTEAVQLDMLKPTIYQEFLQFMETPFGREVANRFIRIAWGVWKRGKRVGSKAIWERIRWHYTFRSEAGNLPFKFNNNYTAYMARLAEEKEPRLKGFFNHRELRNGTNYHPSRAILVMLKTPGERTTP